MASVLLDLHTRVDAAVADAYGWSSGLPDDVLAHLAALNAARRSEEESGTVRYLCPAFQPPSGGAQAGLVVASEKASRAPTSLVSGPVALPPTLRAQLNAARAFVESSLAPVSPSDVASAFTGLKRPAAADLLDALSGLGLLREMGGTFHP